MAQDSIVLRQTVLDVRIVTNNLHIPWELRWGPDDHLWCTLRDGYFVRIHPAAGSMDTILDLTATIYAYGESGLLGFTFDPDWAAGETYVYLAYTASDPSNNHGQYYVKKYFYNGSALTAPQTLVGPVPAWLIHSGSRLMFLHDTSLLITVGDANILDAPLSLDSLNGKVLRLRRDGSVPPDNPISGSPVWSYGHRNAQGLVQLPDGRIFSSEHGPDSDDELNLLMAAYNYGWPEVEGFCDMPWELAYCGENSVEEPEIAWTPTLAVSDLVYYDHPIIPEWYGSLLMTTLKEMDLRQIAVNGDTVEEVATWFNGQWGRLRDICIAPDGTVYIAANHFQGSNPHLHNHPIIELKARRNNQPTTGPELRIYQKGRQLHVEALRSSDQIAEWQMSTSAGAIVFTSDRTVDSPPAHLATGIYHVRVLLRYSGSNSRHLRFRRVFWVNHP